MEISSMDSRWRYGDMEIPSMDSRWRYGDMDRKVRKVRRVREVCRVCSIVVVWTWYEAWRRLGYGNQYRTWHETL